MVLLIIDAQNGIVNNKLYAFERIEANIRRLIAEARQNKVEVIYVRHDDGAGKLLHKGNEETSSREASDHECRVGVRGKGNGSYRSFGLLL